MLSLAGRASLPTENKPLARTTERRSRWGGLSNAVFYGLHAACLLAFLTGVSPVALAVCLALYWGRMFAITGGYHRYFSHSTFKTGRAFQFALALAGASSGQKGPLWWAAHHRNHHRYADTERDIHSPRHGGLWWSHAGWVLSIHFSKTDAAAVPDLARFPELRWLDRHHLAAPLLLAACVFLLGSWLEARAPALGADGPQLLVWGFIISTVCLYHATFTINSLAHVWGRRRFATKDDSRNNLWLALLTMGEGWHNNHHRCPGSERQGLFWWEIDPTHYLLSLLSRLGLVWDLRPPPPGVYAEAGPDP